VPNDVLERLWTLWQTTPLLCTLTVPVKVNTRPLAVARGLRTWHNRQLQHDLFSQGDGNKQVKQITLKASGAERVCFASPGVSPVCEV
jgi:hypothetical protein